MATSSGQLSALAKCQSAILRWMLKVVSMYDCQGRPRSIASAACTRNAPRWGFCCRRLMASIALRSTLRTPEGRPWGLSFQTLLAFLDPPFEDPVDGGFMHPEVPCDALRSPPFQSAASPQPSC